MVSKAITEAEMKLVANIARDFAYKWPSASKDDLEAEMYLHMMENYKYVEQYRTLGGEKGRNTLAKALSRRAMEYVRGEVAHQTHKPEEEATSRWPKKAIVEALKHCYGDEYEASVTLTHTDWEVYREGRRDPSMLFRGYKDHEEITLLIYGVKQGLKMLSREQQDLLRLRHGLGMGLDEIAEHKGKNVDTVKRAIYRAHDALTRKVGYV